jgi:type VI secretion system protein ImpJ
MNPTSKILWGEGLFLRPQHFQRQDAYHEARLADQARVLHPYAWGLRRLVVDTDALASNVLRLDELQLVLPDGELFTAPQIDPLPPPVSLQSIPAAQTDRVFHAALAPLHPNGSNFSAEGREADGARRYAQRTEAAADWFTSAAAAPMSTLSRTLRLLPDEAARDHLIHMPLLRLRRAATGGFELDAGFVPPCTSLAASPALQALLRRQLDVLQAKVDALYGLHREPSRHVIEFRSGDVASFWLLHTASSAFARLVHLHHHRGLHPERLFQDLLQLAGALLTFSKSFTLADLPTYDHHLPGPAFDRLDHIIRELLETVISTRSFAIPLAETKPSFLSGRLDSERIGERTSFVLCARSSLPLSELVDLVPMRVKVGAPDDVDKLVLSATAGVRLAHTPQVPAAIPVRAGAAYFNVEPRGPLYDRMLQARTATFYVPVGVPDLELELFALEA